MAQFHVSLLDELHVEGAREVFFLLEPLVEEGVHRRDVEAKFAKLKLRLGK